MKKELNQVGLKELMVVIRKNSQDSPCISNFEKLLEEVSNESPEFVNCVVNSTFNFFTEFFEVVKSVSKVQEKRYQSKMLTVDFIRPERFFNRVKKSANDSMRIRSSIELLEQKFTKSTLDSNRIPLRVTVNEAEKLVRQALGVEENWEWLNKNYPSNDKMKSEAYLLKEDARKKMLIWNYIPAVVKAIIQSKRRSLGMDKNSKRFI